ncbi:hypothetical protein GS501_08525 [Saccharibacter sp. 17.LH.SD]|uniref:OmpA family protein n=1 Tax=Saccharibacter sp. 17.LH.SD TaxID=2689393 RepID=UPI0013683CD6|nr:OmpA family protein [Saccharibacter sp. 17.LH.SD]MXV45082.1 hypothetical protein [Saccharibacter sp. 17.LH.SD]
MTSHRLRPVLSRSTTSFSRVRTGLGLVASLLLLTGCQHRSATDTTADWVHGIEGGEIYRLRPPTPGFDQPFPHVGRTPTTTPEFPTPEARADLTRQLEAERNYAQRASAANGPLLKTKAFAPPPPPGNGNSTTLISQSGGHGRPAPSLTTPNNAAPSNSSPQQGKTSSLTYQPISHALPNSSTLPSVSAQPPTPIAFPGFAVPATTTAATPNFDISNPGGTLIRFLPETDQISENQDNRLQSLADNRHNNIVIIRGFGTALSASAGLTPDDQRNEITLGLLRARAVANNLIKRGVPAEVIQLRGDAIGDGVRVVYRIP